MAARGGLSAGGEQRALGALHAHERACSGARAARSEGSGGGGRDSPTARSLQLWAGQQLAHPLTAATNALRAPFNWHGERTAKGSALTFPILHCLFSRTLKDRTPGGCVSVASVLFCFSPVEASLSLRSPLPTR